MDLWFNKNARPTELGTIATYSAMLGIITFILCFIKFKLKLNVLDIACNPILTTRLLLTAVH